MTATYDAIVIGSGLAGLSAAFDLVENKQKVLVMEAAERVGGRTSNWLEAGMEVESGIHKFVGVYKEFPRLLRRAGLRLKDVFIYQDEIEIRVAEGGDKNADPERRRRSGRFGMSLFFRPLLTLWGVFDNRELLSWTDKWKLLRIVVAGTCQYLRDPESLDQLTIAQFARQRGASDNLVNTVLFAFSGGLFFLPPERYSACAFFSLLWASIKRSYASRVAVFRGGMTDVMAAPLAEAIKRRGGEVLLGTKAERIILQSGAVAGVEVGSTTIATPRVVVATQIAAAKNIIQTTFGGQPPSDAELRKLLSLPDMSGVAVQIELDAPGLPDDHIIFGANSILGTFGEQSHTTFRESAGRISAFLSPGEPFMAMSDEEVVSAVIRDLQRQGVDVEQRIKRFAVVRHASEFYLLEPGSEERRPRQRTSVRGLVLAGDYTKQPLICSMEGAVISGRLAAKAVLKLDEG